MIRFLGRPELALAETANRDEIAFRATTLAALAGRRPSDVLRVVGPAALHAPALWATIASLRETAIKPRLVLPVLVKPRKVRNRPVWKSSEATPGSYYWGLRALAVAELQGPRQPDRQK